VNAEAYTGASFSEVGKELYVPNIAELDAASETRIEYRKSR